MTRSESKYYATAARMDEAFLKLLEEKDFAYITVKEICEKAGVNRSTFYLHYETVNDLLVESARYIIDKLIAAMPQDTAGFLDTLQTRSLEDLHLITPEYLTPYLNFIRDHRRLFRASVEHASVLGMDDAYLALYRHVFQPILERFHVPPSDQQYFMLFYLHGLMGIIHEWLKQDCRDPIEHIISVMRLCIPPCER